MSWIARCEAVQLSAPLALVELQSTTCSLQACMHRRTACIICLLAIEGVAP
jgi:hypothetical protein